MTDRILDQIRALLDRTTDRGCTEHEAANAAFLVENLLRKHNLTLSDVGEKSEVGIKYSELAISLDINSDWLVALHGCACSLCMVNGMTFESEGFRRFAFVGNDIDCASSEQIFRFFSDSACKATASALSQALTASPTQTLDSMVVVAICYMGYLERGRVEDTPESKAKFEAAFLLGYAGQLQQRVWRYLQHRETKESQGLVRFKGAEATEFMQKEFPGVAEKQHVYQDHTSKTYEDSVAIRLGMMAAFNTPISTDKALA